MANVEQEVEQMNEKVNEVGCDTAKFTPEESIEYYEGIASNAEQWAQTLKEEIGH